MLANRVFVGPVAQTGAVSLQHLSEGETGVVEDIRVDLAATPSCLRTGMKGQKSVI